MRVLRDARGNLLPANIALNQHAPSPLPAAHSSSSSSSSASSDPNDVRNLSPAERYLSERGSRVRRQSVCLTLNVHNRVVFDTPNGGALTVQESVVPLLLSLAQTTLLHCIVIEADKTKQASVSGTSRVQRARGDRVTMGPSPRSRPFVSPLAVPVHAQ